MSYEPKAPKAHPDPETYMTHHVVRTPSDDGHTVKVTGWCTGCNPDNCCGCCHIEDVVDE